MFKNTKKPILFVVVFAFFSANTALANPPNPLTMLSQAVQTAVPQICALLWKIAGAVAEGMATNPRDWPLGYNGVN